MVKFRYIVPALVLLAQVSCIPPKAVAVAEMPKAPKKEKPPEPVATVPELPADQNDGLRMPDMLGLPSDGEFRSTVPGAPKTGGEAGAVIVRPPTDPPSRVKPKDPVPTDQR